MRSDHDSIIEHLKHSRYKDAELESKEYIRANPLDGQGWVMLGESLLHQGYGQAAKRVFNRAWLLDPEAAWVKEIFEVLSRTPDGDERDDIEGLLHVKKVTVAAAILSRNEEAHIEQCITALYDAVDEIILVDSSEDRTREIAASFSKVNIVPIEWKDDFADARNEGLAQIKSDWVLWIDADEVLVSEDMASVREIAGLFHDYPEPPVLHIWQLNSIRGYIQHDFSQSRMFQTNRGLRYLGRIHEQVGTHAGLYESGTYRRSVRIRVLHDGYEPLIVQSTKKLERNLRLLKLATESEPDNPGNWLYYGRESFSMGLDQQALEALLVAEELSERNPLFGRRLEIYRLKAQIYIHRKDWNRAEEACLQAIQLNKDFPDAHYLLGQIRMKQADELYRKAEASIKQSIQSLPHYRGVVSADYEIQEWKAELAIGDMAIRAGKLAEAHHIYRKHEKRHPNKEALSARIAAIEQQRQQLNHQASITPNKTRGL
jgi:glycosyltransferase involved in cell wall biosynthesis